MPVLSHPPLHYRNYVKRGAIRVIIQRTAFCTYEQVIRQDGATRNALVSLKKNMLILDLKKPLLKDFMQAHNVRIYYKYLKYISILQQVSYMPMFQ